MSSEGKKRVVMVVCALLFLALFLLVIKSLDNAQPSVEDVMTNNGPTIHDFIEQ